MQSGGATRMTHRRWNGGRRWPTGLALLLLGSAVTCFSGDGFEGKVCKVADDCNPTLDGFSTQFACIAERCEVTLCGTPEQQCAAGGDENDGCLQTCHKYKCGDGDLTELAEGCDDGNSDDADGCNNDCRKVAVAIGSGPAADHVCAVSEGQVRCWGRNGEGQLGRGNTANLGDEANELPPKDPPPKDPLDELLDEPPPAPPPADIPGEPGVTKVVATESGTCVLRDTGAVNCWGLNADGLLGAGKLDRILIGDQAGELPADKVELGGDAVDLVGGAQHVCALMKTGKVRCWGSNESNQLGHEDTQAIGDNETPASKGDLAIAGVVVQLAAGRYHTCALTKNGDVFCWGLSSFGQVGYLNLSQVEEPRAEPVDIGAKATQIAAGGYHTCALLSETEMRCWGDGFDGALGNNQYGDVGLVEAPAKGRPVEMLAKEDRVDRIYAGGSHTCVLLVGGAVRCWGAGSSGQLGLGHYHDFGDGLGAQYGLESIPPRIEVGGAVLDLALGYATTCALLVGGQVRCWGRNSEGQLGLNNTDWIGDEEGEMPPDDAMIYRTPGRFTSAAK